MKEKIRTFRVDDEIWNTLKKKCKENDTNVSQFLRKSIKEFIKYKNQDEKENNDSD